MNRASDVAALKPNLSLERECALFKKRFEFRLRRSNRTSLT
jgi:hypothetical protein